MIGELGNLTRELRLMHGGERMLEWDGGWSEIREEIEMGWGLEQSRRVYRRSEGQQQARGYVWCCLGVATMVDWW